MQSRYWVRSRLIMRRSSLFCRYAMRFLLHLDSISFSFLPMRVLLQDCFSECLRDDTRLCHISSIFLTEFGTLCLHSHCSVVSVSPMKIRCYDTAISLLYVPLPKQKCFGQAFWPVSVKPKSDWLDFELLFTSSH